MDTCPTCPGVSRLTAGTMLVAASRAGAALAVFRSLFDAEEVTEAEDAAPKVVGATPEQIAVLPLMRFLPENESSEPGSGCSICLSDYCRGDSMRRLPCSHAFHRRCVDTWLHRNKRCPLCVQAIDDPSLAPPPPAAPPEAQAQRLMRRRVQSEPMATPTSPASGQLAGNRVRASVACPTNVGADTMMPSVRGDDNVARVQHRRGHGERGVSSAHAIPDRRADRRTNQRCTPQPGQASTSTWRRPAFVGDREPVLRRSPS